MPPGVEGAQVLGGSTGSQSVSMGSHIGTYYCVFFCRVFLFVICTVGVCCDGPYCFPAVPDAVETPYHWSFGPRGPPIAMGAEYLLVCFSRLSCEGLVLFGAMVNCCIPWSAYDNILLDFVVLELLPSSTILICVGMSATFVLPGCDSV